MGGSVKVTFAFLAKLTLHPFFITWAWQEATQVYMPQAITLLPWSASAVFWICFLDCRAESPAERRRGPLWPFVAPSPASSQSKPCAGLYGALRGSCEVDLRLPACSSANLLSVIGDPRSRFDCPLNTDPFFLVFILFLVPLSI